MIFFFISNLKIALFRQNGFKCLLQSAGQSFKVHIRLRVIDADKVVSLPLNNGTHLLQIFTGHTVYHIVHNARLNIAAGYLPPKTNPLVHIGRCPEFIPASAAEKLRLCSPDFLKGLFYISSRRMQIPEPGKLIRE